MTPFGLPDLITLVLPFSGAFEILWNLRLSLTPLVMRTPPFADESFNDFALNCPAMTSSFQLDQTSSMMKKLVITICKNRTVSQRTEFLNILKYMQNQSISCFDKLGLKCQ
jgi:hypothetical protein